MRKAIISLCSLLLLLSCSPLDRKVNELSYKEDIREMKEHGKLTDEEAVRLTMYIQILQDTKMPTKTGINRTYRQLLKEAILPDVQRDGHNASNSLSYGGTYEGTIPGSDASEVEVVITLDYAGNYTKQYTRHEDKAGSLSASAGRYVWDDDGAVITLSGEEDGEKFKVVENAILMIYKDGKEITGDSAGMYRLEQVGVLE